MCIRDSDGAGGVPRGLVDGVAADAEEAGSDELEKADGVGVGGREEGLGHLAFFVAETGEGGSDGADGGSGDGDCGGGAGSQKSWDGRGGAEGGEKITARDGVGHVPS